MSVAHFRKHGVIQNNHIILGFFSKFNWKEFHILCFHLKTMKRYTTID